jgi:hypothetical protein
MTVAHTDVIDSYWQGNWKNLFLGPATAQAPIIVASPAVWDAELGKHDSMHATTEKLHDRHRRAQNCGDRQVCCFLIVLEFLESLLDSYRAVKHVQLLCPLDLAHVILAEWDA